MFAIIICYIRGFVTYKCHTQGRNSCNMGTHGLPDIYTLSVRAYGPRVSGVYIRQTTLAHVTTMYCTPVYVLLCM